jgi:DNA helicase II / ATP-dependent DNA helicase PcrA
VGKTEYTDEQSKFLQHDPASSGRLVAGPGAGKSFTCVAYMQQHTASERPLRIQMITFTRAAAAEFSETMSEHEVEALAPSTIHAFALKILRKSGWAGIPQPVRIADTWETKNLIHPQLSRLLRAQGHDDATPGTVDGLEREMSAGFESLAAELPSAHRPELRHAYIGLWEQHRQRLGYVLRSELPYRAGMAIEDVGFPDLQLDLLLVDEYQDLNKADIKLLHLVAGAGVPVVAIGDEDQSIYGWRHAAPEGIRNFLEEFQTEKDYRLSKSRRCGENILKAAQDLIESAPGRPAQARMTALNQDKPGVIAYLRFVGQTSEAEAVASFIQKRIADGVPPRKVAILVRSSVDAWERSLRDKLAAHNITVASDAWVMRALNDPELLRLRAMAILALNIEDSLAWMTLLHLVDGIGPSTIDALYGSAGMNETFAQVVLRAVDQEFGGLTGGRLRRLREAITGITNELKEWLIPDAQPETGWGHWLLEKSKAALNEDANHLLELVDAKVEKETPLGAFLPQIEMLGTDFAMSDQDSIRFMTMGKSKGLTMDTVVILGVEEGMIPSPRGVSLEEERRLLYVGMTRATDYCIFTMCRRRQGPIARRGRENLEARSRSPLLNGVLEPQDDEAWIKSELGK